MPYVPEKTEMREFTFRAVLIGLVMTVVLGAANAYLGLRAGMTIAATYPAAVIGMALLRLRKGSLLEENIARTVGSIGESVAAGAIFTIPAFVMSGAWDKFDSWEAYWKSTALMLVGGVLGILFVTLLRRVMVEDPELVFPESVAASQIHIAGQQGAQAARILFYNMGFGAAIYLLGAFNIFSASNSFLVRIGEMGKSAVKLVTKGYTQQVGVGGVTLATGPAISPAYLGVGYIIGPQARGAEFLGRRGGVGSAGAAAGVFPGPGPDQGQSGSELGTGDRRHLEIRGQADRRGRHAGGRLLHAVPHAEEPGQRHGARGVRLQEGAVAEGRDQPPGSRPERADGVRRTPGGPPVHGPALHLLLGHLARRRGRGAGDGRTRILLRGRFGEPGGADRLVQQPGFGADAGDARGLGAVDGRARRFGSRGRGGSAGRGRGGVRFFRRGGRDAAGSQGRAHPGRHAAQHGDWGHSGNSGGQRGAVLPAAGVAQGVRRFRKRRDPRSAGRA